MNPERKAHFDNILDCMSGADGGIAFMKTKILIEQLEKVEEDGNIEAEKALSAISQFSKFITYATNNIGTGE